MRHEPTYRVLAVIEALAADGPPLPLTEIAREVDASRSTLHAVLAGMQADGWAEKVGGGWRAGPHLRTVAASLAAEVDLVRAARQPLEALVDKTGLAAVVFEVRDGMAEVVDSVGAGPRTAAREPVQIGHVVPVRAPFARDLAARRNTTAETVDQAIYRVDRDKKRDLLAHLILRHGWHQVLVFTRTKHGANRLAEQLSKQDIPAMAIHGNKSQSARTRALGAFKSGELQVLVATDIAARGLDINELPYVVNFELPNVAEDYVHRIGRTGRAGSEGQAVSLVCVDEHGLLKGIERLIKRDLDKHIEPGFEPDPNAKPEPIENGRNRRGGRHGQPRQNSGTERRTRSATDAKGTDARPSRRRRSRAQGSQRA